MIAVGDKKAIIVKGDYTPAEMYRGNNKIAGFHDTEIVVPGMVEGTYNDTVKITAKGQSFQQTYEATEQQTGSLVQMELPAGQPIDVVVNIEAEQYGEGEPSSENVRAIVGSDCVRLLVSEKSLLHYSTDTPARGINGSGEIYITNMHHRITDLIEVSGKGYISATGVSNQTPRVVTYDTNQSILRCIIGTEIEWISLMPEEQYIRIGYVLNMTPDIQAFYGKNIVSKMITLPETSYGGYVDWTQKKYIQTHKAFILDDTITLGSLSKLDEGFLEVNLTTGGMPNTWTTLQSTALCNMFHVNSAYNVGIRGQDGIGSRDSSTIYLRDPIFVGLTADEAKATVVRLYDAGTPIVFVSNLVEPIEYDLSEQITDELTASFDGITTVYSEQAGITVNGAAVPSPWHPSMPISSRGTVESIGKNIFELLPDTNTSGSNASSTIYLSMLTKELAGMAKVKSGETYIFTREYAGGQLRYFFYEEYPLDSKVVSMSGRYCNPSSCREKIVIPKNAHYFVARVTDNKVKYPAGKCMLTKAETSGEYIPYYPATQMELPQLRAIPGTTARDELIPVEGQPGWYNVLHNIGVLQTKDCVWHQFSSTNFTSWYCCPFQNRVPPKVKLDIKPGETPRSTAVLACNVATCYWDSTADRLTQMRTQNVQHDTNRLYWFNDFGELGDDALPYLQSLWDNSGGVVWYEQVTPTVERIYLGELKTFPRYTILSAEGELLPDIAASFKVQD